MDAAPQLVGNRRHRTGYHHVWGVFSRKGFRSRYCNHRLSGQEVDAALENLKRFECELRRSCGCDVKSALFVTVSSVHLFNIRIGLLSNWNLESEHVSQSFLVQTRIRLLVVIGLWSFNQALVLWQTALRVDQASEHNEHVHGN